MLELASESSRSFVALGSQLNGRLSLGMAEYQIGINQDKCTHLDRVWLVVTGTKGHGCF